MEGFHVQLLGISESLRQEDFNKLKLVCQDVIPEGTLERMKSASDLFVELKHRGYLSEEKTDYLASLLFQIGRHDLKNKLVGKESQKLVTNVGISHIGSVPFRSLGFINREGETREIMQELTSKGTRLVTIVGPPGVGKSSLAFHIGHELMSPMHSYAIYCICLQNMASMYSIAIQVLASLGIPPADDALMQAHHFLLNLEKETVVILDNAEFFLESDEKQHFLSFVKSICERAPHVRVLMTTSQAVKFLSFAMKEVMLKPLSKEHSGELIRRYADHIPVEAAEELGQNVCGGMPLILRAAASCFNHSMDYKTVLSEYNTYPVKVLKWLANDEASPEEEQIFTCLDNCFEKLSDDLKSTLVSLSIFPDSFSIEEAGYLLPQYGRFDLGKLLMKLADHCLLQFDKLSNWYSLQTIVQVYCFGKTRENNKLRDAYNHAKNYFTRHYLLSLETIHSHWLSPDMRSGLESFIKDRRKISQAFKYSIEVESLRNDAIDMSTKVRRFMTKALRKERFVALYNELAKAAKINGDEKRYAEVLTSIGHCILYYCACKLPCPSAVEHFNKASRIQGQVNDNDSESRIVVLAKLGRCMVQSEVEMNTNSQENIKKGLAMIERAINLRKERGDEVYLANTYDDLAAAHCHLGRCEEAIKIRLEKSLPILRRKVGDHPFTATLLDSIGTSYLRLKEHEAAVLYKRQSLEMRRNLLGFHQETSWSYSGVGRALKAHGKLTEALESFEKAMEMQEAVLGAHKETLATYESLRDTMTELRRVKDLDVILKKIEECKRNMENFNEMKQPSTSVAVTEPRRGVAHKEISHAYAEFL